MSASMYNSPYAYKEPHPRIEYPPMFDGLKRISFKHILDSKFLALGACLFGVSLLVGLVCVFSPYWFKLVFSPEDGTFGQEPVKMKLSIDTGIFFMNAEEMNSLIDLSKSSNHEVVPKVLVLAKMSLVLGMCLLVVCLSACLILVFRRLASVTANFLLAFISSITGLLFIVAFICAMAASFMSSCDPYDTGNDCKYQDNLKWRLIPIYTQIFRVEPLVTPYIKLNWTFYISIIGALLALGGSVCVWLEAISAYRKLSQIRYIQLRTARDPHEGDINPLDHGKYVYRPPTQEGPMSYGMQPVAFQGGPYGAGIQPVATFNDKAPHGGHQPEPLQQPRFVGVGFADQDSDSSPPPSRRRGSPPPARRRSPSPSLSGSPPPSPRSSGRRRHSPPPSSSRRRSPPPNYRRRSPSPPERGPGPRRGGPPSVTSSVSEGPYISREIDL